MTDEPRGDGELTPALIVDENVLGDAVREVYAGIPDRDIGEVADPAIMIAIADVYARLLREKYVEDGA